MHFLLSHFNFFQENLGNFSDEHGGELNQDISTMEKVHQLCWLTTTGVLKEKLPVHIRGN
jgi:hypothetical protein